jgi:predicted glycosyltransferase
VQRKEGIVPEIARETEIVESGIEAAIEKEVVNETGATTATGVAIAAGIEAGGIPVVTTMTRGCFSFSGPLSQPFTVFFTSHLRD